MPDLYALITVFDINCSVIQDEESSCQKPHLVQDSCLEIDLSTHNEPVVLLIVNNCSTCAHLISQCKTMHVACRNVYTAYYMPINVGGCSFLTRLLQDVCTHCTNYSVCTHTALHVLQIA